MAQLVKSLPAVWETWVRSLGWEDPLEKVKATHSSFLAWRIPCAVHGVAKSQTMEKTLESPLDCKEIKAKQSILKEISPEYSLKGLKPKL